MLRSFPLRYAVWLAPFAAGLVACDPTGPGTRPLSLSVTTRSSSAAASPSRPAGLSADLHVGDATTSLTIKSAQIVLSEIELSGTGTCGEETSDNEATDDNEANGDNDEANGNNNDNHEEDCDEMELGPLSVDLQLDGTTQAILDAGVRPGKYSGLQAELEGVTVSGIFTDANGTDHPFTYTSSVEAKIEMEFPTPVDVDGSTKNLTIEVDVASWFIDADGMLLDPRDPAKAGAINANIRKSFRAFGDDDHDGLDDHHEETGDH